MDLYSNWEFEDDDVWDEDKWEQFMQEADRKAEEYLKRLEGEYQKLEEQKKNLLYPDNVYQELGIQFQEETKYTDDEVEKDSLSCKMYWEDDSFNGTQNIPAYKIAYEFALAVLDFVKRNYHKAQVLPEEVSHLLKNSLVIPAKIAGGHGLGYYRDTLEGNIANCKRGLVSACESVRAIEDLRIKTSTTPELRRLYAIAVNTMNTTAQWIEELRSRIWWR